MMKNRGLSILKRCFCSGNSIKPKICVVGGGPAGFYAAQHLAKKLENSQIDIMERLPVPFGLVRFGVAPDHPEVKNVIHTFTKTAESPNVNFYGNISLGKDISLEDLKQFYHIIILTYGAEQNKKLDIPGVNLKNVLPARNIVGWYNGVPSDKNLNINLNCETVAIIGQGNVAIDVARILLTPIDELKKTDITQHSLNQLSQSKIKKIVLIGRRGPLQAAFTIKELREMLKLKNCLTLWKNEDFETIETPIVEKLARPKKRITELMLKSVQEQKIINNEAKIFNPVFLRSPLEILGDNQVEKIVLGVNKLTGNDLLTQTATLTDQIETLDCDLVISSIGYKSIQADPNIPFDLNKGIIKNTKGKIDAGLYTSGWLGTGPVGVILSTMSNAFAVTEQIIEDIPKDNLLKNPKPGFEGARKILDQKNVQLVTWKDWAKIDKYEISLGEKAGKPREKIVDIEQMLKIASS
ncbi:unnamed protein product [Ceutorhynchus assimilis]|uniref:NADPH:adrenodoxin oxidoreductase, mitochondrial n=1 Tax=Ceutorhynchus assimilis TaxID=467358 RepID=A0A9N9QNL3_9CUCU|nr:unnamed protein product [Ceutorhynchus assimilis]